MTDPDEVIVYDVSDLAEALAPEPEPGPPAVPTVVEPMGRVEVPTLLPTPARAFLGVTAKRRMPVLADGWCWVAYRSVGLHWRNKLGDRPAGFVSLEVWSVRVAGPFAEDGQRWRAVALWSRPWVCLTRGKPSAKTGKRPVRTAAWSSEAWLWRAGMPGSLPTPVSLGEAGGLVRAGRPTQERWEAMAVPLVLRDVADWARTELGAIRAE